MDAAVTPPLEEIWAEMQRRLAAAVEDSTYRVWLEPLAIRELDGDRLVVEAPTRTFTWVHNRFGRLLQACAQATVGPEVRVEIVQSDPPGTGRAGGHRSPGTPGRGRDQTTRRAAGRRTAAVLPSGDPEGSLWDALHAKTQDGNPRLAFEHFVIGDSNRLAHAAALAVAELPGHAFNPLFLCGPPGVGKTHLLHSIARMILSHSPGLNVQAGTGESFTSEFQLALGADRMDTFKAHFRHVDVLLVDDVQFLERKARTEEEFFHTFDALYEAGAQLVLTSDRPPRDLQALEDRLRERFEAGLVADVRPPDFHTRLAILRKRAQHDGLDPVEPAVLDTIAQRVTLNVRALEGALIRTVALGSLTGRALSVELATQVLDELHPSPPSAHRSLAEIKDAACAHFDVTPDELLSPVRAMRVAWPRQVAMYLARELTDESYPAIGRYFGGRDHTTALHAWRRTAAKIQADARCRHTVDTLRNQLERTSC